jgi:vacuolar-type H+-ATPase subunit E/Vma4
MTRYYDEIDSFERDGFTVIVDKSWEDLNPRDHFEDENIEDIIDKIERGVYDWFMLRVRLMVDEYEVASEYLGGCLYENPKDVIIDGTADDLIDTAMVTAKREVYRMYKKFQEISWEHDCGHVA